MSVSAGSDEGGNTVQFSALEHDRCDFVRLGQLEKLSVMNVSFYAVKGFVRTGVQTVTYRKLDWIHINSSKLSEEPFRYKF